MPMSKMGAEDGFRARALIVPCPMTATTIEGPTIAAVITKNNVAKGKVCPFLPFKKHLKSLQRPILRPKWNIGFHKTGQCPF